LFFRFKIHPLYKIRKAVQLLIKYRPRNQSKKKRVKDQAMCNQNISSIIKQLLIDTLSLDLAVEDMENDLLLLGNIPEFDSMAIVSIITAIEEEFNFMADDDDLSAEVFESVASLICFVEERI